MLFPLPERSRRRRRRRVTDRRPAAAGLGPETLESRRQLAAVAFSGSPYTQTFDTLGTSLSGWANDSTLPAWSLFTSGKTAVTALTSGVGSANAGSFYNFGSSGASDRALGGVGSGGVSFGSPAVGAVAGWMTVAISNATGSSQPSFVLRYDGEQWRNGGNTATNTTTVEYGYGATFAGVTAWTSAGSAFTFTSPQVGATAVALDGNASANRVASIGGTITPVSPWASGSTLWIRWAETNEAGSDHGMAIDNVSFSLPTSVVTPPTAPAITTVTPGDRTLTVAFTPPASNGGGLITGYQYSLDDGGTWQAPSPAVTTSPLVITGLVNGTTYGVRIRAVNSAGAGSASTSASGRPVGMGNLRIVSYNIAAADTLPRTGLGTLVQAMSAETYAGLADRVDLLAIQEVQSQAVTSANVAATLNSIYGVGTYAAGTVNGATTGSGTQGVVYNTASLQLLDERAIGTASTTGGPRQTLRYSFQPKDGDATTVFYVYVSHLKSLDTTADAARRDAEASVIRADADALPAGSNILYVGDFNLYRSSEPAYQTFLRAGSGQAFDPLDRPGDWHSNASFVDTFTQAPLSTAPSGFTGGGLDDRFDFQLVSGAVMAPGGFTYLAGSYRTFGNNGSVPRNGSINSPSSTALPGLANRTQVLDLLTTVSDHLPVVADYAYASIASPPPPPPSSGDLLFSEYVEGTSNNKYLEIYNGGSTTATLSNYEVRLFGNGSATATQTQPLGALTGGPATLAPGATLVIANASAALALPAGVASFTSSVTNFNGNDALGLWKVSSSGYVDIFGVIGSDPGTAWTSGSLTTMNATGRGRGSVTAGVAANPATFATLGTEWEGFAIDTVSGLGTHAATPPVPASIAGVVWCDTDGDGIRDPGEAAASGWTVFLDQDANGLLGSGEASVVTGSSGAYSFPGLAAGSYRVTLLPRAGWEQTFPAAAPAADVVVQAADPTAGYAPATRQQATRSIPNDPLFSKQWHLQNTGQTGGTAGEDARLPGAWNSTTGTGVVIGIVDDGLQGSHPDLSPNFRADLSYDFNGDDADPTPGTGDDHGTSAAGVAAARGNNGIGVSGSAPNAGLAGIRLIAATTTDEQEASGLSHRPQDIDIYSNSWGPDDDGFTLEGPGPLTRAALANAVRTGRGGLGSIYVWAAGNGLDAGDNSNYDGYANSRFTIAVSAVDHRGRQSWYSEPGANILVAVPSDGGSLTTQACGIVTTDRTGTAGYNPATSANGGDYADDFGGTSSATPLVSGVVALMLQANPNLGWRDVQHVLARSARKNDATDVGWSQNAAGRWINDKYGFGMIDATAAVSLASTWTNVGGEVTATSGSVTVGASIPDNSATGITSSFTLGADITMESVELTLNARHASRGDLRVVLTSPSGTQSVLADEHPDTGIDYLGWTFSTVRGWGESAAGTWTLTVSDLAAGSTGTLDSWSLDVYGTRGAGYVPPPVPMLVSVAAGEDATGRSFGVRQVQSPTTVFDVAAGQTQVDATAHSGAESLVKRGGGTLVLSGASTHTGGVAAEAGEIVVRNVAALGSGPLSIAAGARVSFDVAAAGVTVASLTGSGLLDVGGGRVTVTSGLTGSAVRDLIVAGSGDGSWNGTAGITSSAVAAAVAASTARSLGWLDNGDGSVTVGFAAPGDTDLDGVVDVLDLANVMSSGAYGSSLAATWAQGDFTYDGVVDILDVSALLGSGLYGQSPYTAALEADSGVAVRAVPSDLSTIDAAFAAFAMEQSSATPRKRTPRVG